MRRAVKKPNIVRADDVYGSTNVSKLINYVMKDGKKDVARSIVYKAFEMIKADEALAGQEPVEVLDRALQNVGPLMEVRSRRVGGANYQVPREVRAERRLALALRWIVEAAGAHKGSPMHKGLAAELTAASKNEGSAIKKKEDTHRMAEANRAFAHFAW